MSQMPEVAGSWPDEGPQYLPGAPMEPVQQSYQQQAQYQQAYPQQHYVQAPQYPAPQQPPYPPAAPPQQGAYQEQTVPQPAVFAEDERSSVPSEFDHLFRDSVPAERRSISRQAVVGGAPPAPGFAQPAAQPAPAPAPQPAATAMFNPPQDQPSNGYPQQSAFGGAGHDGYEPLPTRPGRGRAPLVIGGVVAAVAAVGLYLGLSGGSGSSGGQPAADSSSTATAAPKLTAQQEADALYQLVAQAKSLRSYANGGYTELLACNIPSAQSDIGNAVSGRQTALASLAKMDVSKIDGAADVVAALKTAWTDSYTSDNYYAKAAADFAGGATCTKAAVQADANLQAANQGSSDSSRAKAAAAKLWNQTMVKYNEPSISSSQL